MKMDQVASSKNDEFYTPRYAVTPLANHIPKGARVWCPFDTDRSLIVAVLREERGCIVTHSHLDDGQDFFATEPPECDYIISNPPYSLKTEVLLRLFSFNIPFAMLVGVAGLFESERRFAMFEQNEHEIMWMNRRVAYFKSYDDERPSLNPPFSSVWVCANVLPCKNVFARITKS